MYHLIDYVWCVEKFSQYFEPHPQEVYSLLTSPVFAYKNTRWVLNLYPEGLGDAASHGYISLFIKYVSEDPETINARVELSLLNNKNERVYCRDTGDHQYQTFIDFGYKQFLKVQDIRDQRSELVCNGMLKVFARVEFEHSSLPASLTWTNYDLLLFKENFKDLYETKYLCDIVVKVVRKSSASSQSNCLAIQTAPATTTSAASMSNGTSRSSKKFKSSSMHDPNSSNDTSSSSSGGSQASCNCSLYFNSSSSSSSSCDLENASGSVHECCCSSSSCECCNASSVSPLEIKAHKFILASRSGKFRELLKTSLMRRGDTVQVSNCNLLSLCANSLPTKSVLGASSESSMNSSGNNNCSPSSSLTVIDKEQQLGNYFQI
jgi:hypothetical protein